MKVKEHPNEPKYYDVKELIDKHPLIDVFLIIAERANGKSYSFLKYCLTDFVNSGYTNQMAYIRRREEPIKGEAFRSVWNDLEDNEEIAKATGGEWTHIVYRRPAFYLAKKDPDTDKDILHSTPFGYTFALSLAHNYRGKAFPGIKNIGLEEFIRQKGESPLRQELDLFNSIISTIVRVREDAKIFLLGNTTSMISEYFQYFKLGKLGDMEIGEKRKVKFAHRKSKKVSLSVLVHRAPGYADFNEDVKPSDKFFLPQSDRSMIMNGEWDIAFYQKIPNDFKTGCKKLLKYYIKWEDEYILCEVLHKKSVVFTHHKYCTQKPTDKDILFTLDDSISPFVFHNPLKPINYSKKTQVIAQNYTQHHLTFEADEIGEMIKNFVINAEIYDALH